MTQLHAWDESDTIHNRIARNDRVALVLDFDGTLVSIVDQPEEAVLDPSVRNLLDRITTVSHVEVAIVSGRALQDITARIDLASIAYAGNHGLEVSIHDQTWIHPAVARVRDQLVSVIGSIETYLADIPGAIVEDKHATVSVHFRQTPTEYVPDVQDVVTSHVAAEPDLRLGTGKAVLQIRPDVQWDKGDAIRRLVGSSAEETATVFIGDDVTDTDGFNAVETLDGDGITISVGNRDLPAEFYLINPAGVHRWLGWFASVVGAINTDVSV